MSDKDHYWFGVDMPGQDGQDAFPLTPKESVDCVMFISNLYANLVNALLNNRAEIKVPDPVKIMKKTNGGTSAEIKRGKLVAEMCARIIAELNKVLEEELEKMGLKK